LNNPHNQFEIISIEDITHVEAKAEVLVEWLLNAQYII
jgi:hypothetical protein